jgi:hypothetical protein
LKYLIDMGFDSMERYGSLSFAAFWYPTHIRRLRDLRPYLYYVGYWHDTPVPVHHLVWRTIWQLSGITSRPVGNTFDRKAMLVEGEWEQIIHSANKGLKGQSFRGETELGGVSAKWVVYYAVELVQT